MISTPGSPTFSSLGDIVANLTNILTPPERLSVSECAEKYRELNNPGGYIGPWRNSAAPYLVEPMDMQDSTTKDALVFVGPAQSGKTDALILNSVLKIVKTNPMDMIIYSPTSAAARDFSMRRIDRLQRDSEALGSELLAQRDSDNRFDKHYRTGAMLSLSWPSPTEFAGKPIPKAFLTDYDRMDDDIGGDGSPFELASKRTTTFGSFAMTVAESSPSRPVINPRQWIKETEHEAPPCLGIIGLYNRGDKRRWYWPCPTCDEFFIGKFDDLQWEELKTHAESSATVYMVCPCCGAKILPKQRYDLNLRGVWLADGQKLRQNSRGWWTIVGKPSPNKTASYMLNGVAAAFNNWQKLVATYLDAVASYKRTASEEELKKFYNNDLGEPYVSKSQETNRSPQVLAGRAIKAKDPDERAVPKQVRFLVAAADVQKNAFVVQVHGIAPGAPFDIHLVDRFTIFKSNRIDEDNDALWVKPHAYLEDWNVLREQVLDRAYPIDDGSGRSMMIRLLVCDSGGREGVTAKAYDFWRLMKAENYGTRFLLVKGEHTPGAPRAKISYPDASKKDKFAIARGDVPVCMLNSNLLKDELSSRLESERPGHGYVHFPSWLDDKFYLELCNEIRTDKGWINPPHQRNEAWDLLYYTIGACVSQLISVERIDWMNPPAWARSADDNPYVTKPDETTRFQPVEISQQIDWSKLGKALAG